MIIVHHLGVSQSERIIWLMEDLGLPYEFIKHDRDPLLSPDSIKSVPGNITGKSPIIQDTEVDITLGETGAIIDYIVNTYADGKLTVKPGNKKKYTEFLYWYHFGNGSLQAESIASQFLDVTTDKLEDSMIKKFNKQRMTAAYQQMDDRLRDNKWLAGDELTTADIMANYSCTTQRYWGPQSDLSAFPNLLRWLKDCWVRPAYQRMREKGDPEMEGLDGPKPPSVSLIAAAGVGSQHWKKAEYRN